MLDNPDFIAWLSLAYDPETAAEAEKLPKDLQLSLYESVYRYGPRGEKIQSFVENFTTGWNLAAESETKVFISFEFFCIAQNLGAKAINSNFQSSLLNSPDLGRDVLWLNENISYLTMDLMEFPTRINMCLWAVCWAIAGDLHLTGKAREWWEYEILPQASEVFRLMTGEAIIDRPLSHQEWMDVYLEIPVTSS